MIYMQAMTTSGKCYRVERPASSSMDAGAECPWPYAQEQQQQFAVAAESREKARAPKAVELVEVGLDVEPELPDGFDLAVFRKVLAGANRVRTDEGEKLGGTVFLLVADETHVADIGYTLDKIENKGFIADHVCFMTGNIDKKLVKLMKLDGAHIVAAKKSIFLAISCQVEPSGENMQRRTWRLDEHGTKHNVSMRGVSTSMPQICVQNYCLFFLRSLPPTHPPARPPRQPHPEYATDVGVRARRHSEERRRSPHRVHALDDGDGQVLPRGSQDGASIEEPDRGESAEQAQAPLHR